MGGVSAHKLDAHGSWQGELCAVFNLSKDYCSTSITLIVFFCSYDSPFPHSNTVHHSGGLISLAFMRLLLFIGWNVIEVVLYTPTEGPECVTVPSQVTKLRCGPHWQHEGKAGRVIRGGKRVLKQR